MRPQIRTPIHMTGETPQPCFAPENPKASRLTQARHPVGRKTRMGESIGPGAAQQGTGISLGIGS
jgi:hypothetical protein